MKITYFQIEQHLVKTLSPIYLISGEEALLKQDVFQWLRKASLRANVTERIPFVLTKGMNDELYHLLYSRSLLADKRLIEIDCRAELPDKAVAKLLMDYATNPLPENILIFNFDKLEISTLKSKWYDALDKIGISVTLWPIDRANLPGWLIQRAKKYKLTLSPEAANTIADYVEGNLIAAANTLEKLYLLNENPISSDFIKTLMQDEGRFSIFDFSQQIIAGDAALSLRMLKSLAEIGVEPVIILWGITRELRLMAELATQIKSGVSYEKIWQQHKIFSKRQPGIRRFLNRFNHEDCLQLLERAAQIDQIIKGVNNINVWNSLQLFCLRLL